MAYSSKDAETTLFGYLNLDATTVDFIENTSDRGFVYSLDNGEKCVIFIYPISRKADDTKNFFDTRDSGAKERGIAWNYAMGKGLKYFCLAVHDQVDKYKNYVFSLECNEDRIAEVSGTLDGKRNGKGTQVVIPNDFIPSKEFERIYTKLGFYIAVIRKDCLVDYIEKYDNRPYMDCDSTIINHSDYLSPEWFRTKSTDYAQVDEEAGALYAQFQADYSVEKLKALSGVDILTTIFLGKRDENLCHALEFDSRYNQFGSIAGGTAYKYNLYYNKVNNIWQTSFGEGGQRSVSEEEAIKIGSQIRDALVKGAEIIESHAELTTANDYNKLLDQMNEAIPQYITKMWFLKYYHMMFPELLPSFYNETWHKHILCNLNVLPSDSQFIRMGQINCFVKECGISNIVFSKIVFDTLGMPKTFYRIGTGDNGACFDEWKQNSYVAIGWNELGDLTEVYKEDVDSKAIITDGLKTSCNYDTRLASRKYGEINNFYSAVADSTYVVAMNGQKILAIGMLTGSYYFNADSDYGHSRAVQWLKVFVEPKTLPVQSEGKLTTFYPLTNSENICYLYALLRGEDTITEVEEFEISEPTRAIRFHTELKSSYARNRIFFGAPGTGKSFILNAERRALLGDDNETDYERVTFHPDYSYANFVGTYKPIPCKDSDNKDAITYEYVPGPFMRVYVEALKNGRTDDVRPFLLIVEEINRANVAAVFGDIFQLLDRGDDEVSEYSIQASEDIKKYLAKHDVLGGKIEDYTKIRIPDNMFIWATMNSADQGVFPMDTAFKRRWDFTYRGINDSEDGITGLKVILGEGVDARIVEWNKLRKEINGELLTYNINEDKLLGPYFIAKKNLPVGEDGYIKQVEFIRVFKNKVLMYLFDDAAKQKRSSLFSGDDKDKKQYSKICARFEKIGIKAFCDNISSKFIDIPVTEETVIETEATVKAEDDET